MCNRKANICCRRYKSAIPLKKERQLSLWALSPFTMNEVI